MKLASLLSDGRLPLYLPAACLRRRGLLSKIKGTSAAGMKVRLVLTFDLEYDLGSLSENKESRSITPFFDGIIPLLEDGKRESTFFVQGDLVSEYATQLRGLEKKHEVGLHGFAHEPWGSDWFIKEKTPKVEERRNLLAKALLEFEKYGLPRPRSFRAPDMVIDGASMKLLEEAGFSHDSSAPSYKGVVPKAWRINGLVEVPATANPIPELAYVPPRIRYPVFNTHTLASFGESALQDYVETVLRVQKSLNSEGLLVFLAHPWEFSENKKLAYCSGKNFGHLSDMLRMLEEKYEIEYATVGEIDASA